MLKPIQQKLFTTVNELFESGIKIMYDYNIDQDYSNNPKYQNVLKSKRIFYYTFEDDWYNRSFYENFASNHDCKLFKVYIDHVGDGTSWSGLYLIPEVVYTQREDLYVPPLHPFIEKFQNLMDASFEAGLVGAWKKFYYQIYSDSFTDNEKKRYNKNIQKIIEKDELDFETIAPFFLVLVFGFMTATFVLLCEIFYHDFLSEIDFKKIVKKMFIRERIYD